jgi:hypothetical protein
MERAVQKALEQEQEASLSHGLLNEVPDSLGVVDSRPYPKLLDKRLLVAQFHSLKSKKILGTIVNFANHVETLWSGNLKITADFPGFLREALEKGVARENRWLVNPTQAPVMFLAGNIGGLATTTDTTPVWDILSKQWEVEPSFSKAKAQGTHLAWLAQEALQSGEAVKEKNPRLHWKEKSYALQVQNPVFVLASTVIKLLSRPFVKVLGGWEVQTQSHFLSVGGLSLLTVPGELYPEVALGGINTYPGSDFQQPVLEIPPLLHLMPGKTKMMVNACGDFLGYLIPISQWDKRKPFLTGTQNKVYGESNSLGENAAGGVHQNSLSLLEKSREDLGEKLNIPWRGRYWFQLGKGKVTRMSINFLGKIEGTFERPHKIQENVTGYVDGKGNLFLWIGAHFSAWGRMEFHGMELRYRARGNEVVDTGEGVLVARFFP